jgi:hypothetical protein
MTLTEQIDLWHLIVFVLFQAVATTIAVVAAVVKLHNKRQHSLEVIEERITKGDKDARDKAEKQIQAVQDGVDLLEQRVNTLDKDVANIRGQMLTTDQLNSAVIMLRKTIDDNAQQHRQELHQFSRELLDRMDRMMKPAE